MYNHTIKMLAMEEKDAIKERRDQAVTERQSRNTSIHTKKEPEQRSERPDEKKRNATHVNDRARKSYHNDGPGGNYGGY
jgi:hypothetical protein